MRKGIIGAVAAALALGGAAMAFGADSSKPIDRDGEDVMFAPAPPEIGGGPGMAIAIAGGPEVAFEDGLRDDFAKDLAAELGVSADEVEAALEVVAEKHRADHRRAMAEAIAGHLDGVSVEQIEAALATAEEELRQAFEDGEAPAPGDFAQTLADELGVAENEIEEALAAAHEDAFAEHRAELEQDLDDAVEEGRLSEEEANAIRERFDEIPPPPGPGLHEFGPGAGPVGPLPFLERRP